MTNPARPVLPSSVHTTTSAKEANSLTNSKLSLVRAPSTVITSAAELGEPSSNREHHGRADPARHADSCALGDEITRPAERTDDVVDVVAGSERHEIGRALPDRLNDENDRSLCRVTLGDRERDALGAGTEPHDHELTGLARCGDPGSL